MNISSILIPENILLGLSSDNRNDVFENMLKVLEERGQIVDSGTIRDKLIERESLGSTAFGRGVALPHVRCEETRDITLALGISDSGVDFSSYDNKPVRLIAMTLAPPDCGGKYNKILAQWNRLLRNPELRENLLSARTSDEVWHLIHRKENNEGTK